MKEQKNIERLFQEKFKDFEAIPPEKAWNNIAARLNEKKKKRRVIPLWFKVSGIAASLILGFYIYSLFDGFSTVPLNKKDVDTNIQPTVVDGTKKTTTTKAKPFEKNKVEEINKNTIPSLSNEKNNLASDNGSFKSNSINSEKVANESQDINTSSFKENLNVNGADNYVSSSFIKNIKNKNKVILGKENASSITSNEFKKTDEKDILSSEFEKNAIDKEKINTVLQKQNSSSIADKKDIKNTQDSTLVAKISEEVNVLEQLLKEKEVGKNVEEKEKKMQNRWAVSSNASPVYFNSSSNGSPLDTKFESNQKSYNNKLSIGLGVSYAINNKLSIRTGLNTVNLNYNTEEVVFYQDLNTNEIQNLSRNQIGSLINIENKSSDINLSAEINQFGNDIKKYDGELNQQMGYLELPIELSYKIIDKKFGFEFVGGVSTLFLNKNNVSLISNGMNVEIGEATNLNKIHYSTNIGLGFKYSLIKSLDLNFNPMFKYQLNTYSNNSGNFKPYFIGLYSGLSFKF